jgi:hypothetical protein
MQESGDYLLMVSRDVNETTAFSVKFPTSFSGVAKTIVPPVVRSRMCAHFMKRSPEQREVQITQGVLKDVISGYDVLQYYVSVSSQSMRSADGFLDGQTKSAV